MSAPATEQQIRTQTATVQQDNGEFDEMTNIAGPIKYYIKQAMGKIKGPTLPKLPAWDSNKNKKGKKSFGSSDSSDSSDSESRRKKGYAKAN